MNYKAATILIFFIFFFAGWVVIGHTRYHIYETEITKDVSKFVSQREKGIQGPMAWEIYSYHGAPEAIPIIEDPVFKDVVYSLYSTYNDCNAEYQVEVVPQLLEEITNGKWNLWDAYNRVALYRELHLVAYIGASTGIDLGPDNSTDFCGSLTESVVLWEAAGGEREGDWFRVYEQSPQYETLIEQWFTEISGPKEIEPPPRIDNIDELISNALDEGKSEDDPYVQALYKTKEYYNTQYETASEFARLHRPMSVEERYTTATEELEIPFWTNIFCGKILRAEQELIEIAYDRYLTHLSEKDIVRTAIDAGIVEFSGDYLSQRAQKGYDLSYYLKVRRFPFTDLLIDTFLLILSSSVLTFLVMKKVMPGLKLRYAKKE
jgi:hypothetical protein